MASVAREVDVVVTNVSRPRGLERSTLLGLLGGVLWGSYESRGCAARSRGASCTVREPFAPLVPDVPVDPDEVPVDGEVVGEVDVLPVEALSSSPPQAARKAAEKAIPLVNPSARLLETLRCTVLAQ